MGDYGSRSSFDTIAEFARRQRGGNRGGGRAREDSRERDQKYVDIISYEHGSNCVFCIRYEMNVSNDIIGAVIGKKGSKINEIRTLSGANINIMEVGHGQRDRSPDPDRDRIIEISGSVHQVTMAK